MPITPDAVPPDNKDWTWVLERPCPECGFDCRLFPRESVGDLLRSSAESWQEILVGADVSRRPSDDVWSPLEYGCHVRDAAGVYDERLRRMLAEDDPDFLNWDQDATAIDGRYHEQTPERVAADLRTAADALASRFDTVSGEEWERTGNRSDGATFTVESLGRYFVHDVVHHVYDVTGRRGD